MLFIEALAQANPEAVEALAEADPTIAPHLRAVLQGRPPYVIDLGDGQTITADLEPDIARAAERMAASIQTGGEPDPADARLVQSWLVAQDGKYGGINSPPPSFDPAVLDKLTNMLPAASEELAGLIPTWLLDQYRAAGAELTDVIMPRWVSAITADAGLQTRIVLSSLRQATTLFYAMSRHVRRHCPHVAVDSPTVMIVLLDRGWAGCQSCAAESAAVPVDEDPRCRLCDAVVPEYWPVLLSHGGIVLVADVCAACKTEFLDSAV